MLLGPCPGVLRIHKVRQVDLLPDFVGYLAVALGCTDLNRRIPRFSTPYPTALALVVLSIIDM